MDPVLASAIFVLGLAFGSFLNVCIYRLPRDLSVVRPRSTCPRCDYLIRAYDNIPVLSWLILRGRCRNCKAYISPRYLVVELLTGAIFLACYAHFGASLATLKYCAFGFLLLGLIFTDAETQLLPDKMTLPGLALGLGLSLVVPVNDLASQLLPGLVSLPVSSDVSWHLLSLVDAVLGAVVGASFIYGAGAIYLRARGRGRHGLRRCETDGHGGRVSRRQADHLHSVHGIDCGIAVWRVHRAGGVDQAHPPAHETQS